MPQLNQCFFIGNTGADPEQRTTESGKTKLSFRLAIDQGKDSDSLWLTIICWETLAEHMGKYLHKGQSVFVQGRLQVRAYTNKNGADRQAIEVIAHNIQLLGKRQESKEDTKEEAKVA